MNKVFLILLGLFFIKSSFSQDIYKITYKSVNDGKINDRNSVVVYADSEKYVITSDRNLSSQPKFSYEENFIFPKDSMMIKRSMLSFNNSISTLDSTVFGRYSATKTDQKKKILDIETHKSTLSINSNAIEIWHTDTFGVSGSPVEAGIGLGLVLAYYRNGNSGLIATDIEKISSLPNNIQIPTQKNTVDMLTYRDLLWKSKFIQIPIFNKEAIRSKPGVTSDSIMRFAEGTVILKKVRIPEVNYKAQAFIELIEKSSGDAYDRTGSVFLISEDQELSFLDGMKNGMKTLPKYDVQDGKDYLGMTRTDKFSPIFELMRFFTPFGVSHFNDRLSLKGKTWQDSVIYRQDITEFLNVMAGKEVYIGTYIGNYDQGGHTVSLELTIHPGNSNYADNKQALSLFNTTNVMEMGGQTYATLFGSEKGLSFEFELKEDAKNVQLRYITTGHGGWWNGDEFVPKTNSIYWNDILKFSFLPWRVDCGSYRLYNPVSGNFDSGLSSSDLTRSNWCPGTITPPNYIQIGDLKKGKHKITVKIPQGLPQGESISFWNVSGALLYDRN